MFKLVVVSLALTFCMVSCAPATAGTTTTPLVKMSCVGHRPNGFFGDAKDPTVFYQCLHGEHIATFHCVGGTIFDETAQGCVHHDIVCPQPDGQFPVPTNAHKFLDCFGGHGTVKNCPGALIFNPSKSMCDYNDGGVTWQSDPTTVPTTKPTEAGTTKAGVTGTKTGTVGTTASSAVCEGKGNREDPADKHKYFNCHNGKLLHEDCPEDEVFNKTTKQCE